MRNESNTAETNSLFHLGGKLHFLTVCILIKSRYVVPNKVRSKAIDTLSLIKIGSLFKLFHCFLTSFPMYAFFKLCCRIFWP